MLEALKTARFMLGLMTGNADIAELRKTVIKQATDEDTPYESLSDRDKAQCDEAVGAYQAIQGIFTDVVKCKAKMTKVFFEALQAEGFTPDQALAITAAQPLEVKGS